MTEMKLNSDTRKAGEKAIRLMCLDAVTAYEAIDPCEVHEIVVGGQYRYYANIAGMKVENKTFEEMEAILAAQVEE